MGRLEAHGTQSESSMAIEKIRRLLMATITKWWNDNPWRLSAALSYYTLFSLAPLLTIAVGIAAVMADKEVVQEELLGQFEGLMGTPGAEAMANMLRSAGHPVNGTIATLVSLVTLLLVSMGMFSELQDALNLIWRIPGTSSSGLWRALRTQLVSFMLVICTGFLLLASLIMSVILSALGTFIHWAGPWLQTIMAVVDLTVSPIGQPQRVDGTGERRFYLGLPRLSIDVFGKLDGELARGLGDADAYVHVGPFGEGPAHRRDRWPRNELGPCPDSWDPCH